MNEYENAQTRPLACNKRASWSFSSFWRQNRYLLLSEPWGLGGQRLQQKNNGHHVLRADPAPTSH